MEQSHTLESKIAEGRKAAAERFPQLAEIIDRLAAELEESTAKKALAEGDRAPDFELRRADNDEPVRLSEQLQHGPVDMISPPEEPGPIIWRRFWAATRAPVPDNTTGARAILDAGEPPLFSEEAMQKIEAIVRTERLADVKESLAAAGYPGLHIVRVVGRGQQRGVLQVGRGGETYEVDMLPKVKIEVVVPDDVVEGLIDLICESARTGHIGDGKIFVIPVGDAYRVRTRERGGDALRNGP